MSEVLREDARLRPTATYIVVAFMGLCAPLMVAMIQSVQRGSKPITASFYIANYLGILIPMALGYAFQSLWDATSRAKRSLGTRIFTTVLLAVTGFFIILGVSSLFGVTPKAICGAVGMACGSLLWEAKQGSQEKESSTSNDSSSSTATKSV